MVVSAIAHFAAKMDTDNLSEYELKRLRTIAANQVKLLEFGLVQLVPDQAPKAKRVKPAKPTAPAGESRKSGRLSGEAAREVAGAPEELQEDAWRDPDDVSQMTQVERRGWCDELRDSVLRRPSNNSSLTPKPIPIPNLTLSLTRCCAARGSTS